MDVLVVLILLVAVGAGIAVLARRRARARTPIAALGGAPSATPAAAASRDLRRLRVGDVVHHEGRDWIVEQSLHMDQSGFRWDEHRLQDGADSIWLSVEDDEGLEVVLWERLRGTQLEPGDQSIAHDGTTFALDERGSASFSNEGEGGGLAATGTMEYADYQAGERRLSFERFGAGAPWEVSVGSVVSEHAFDVYPSRAAHGG